MSTRSYGRWLIIFLMYICLEWTGIDAARLESAAANGPWEAQKKTAAEAPELENNVMALKNKRDSEIATLIKQRDQKIQSLLTNLKHVTQTDVAKINQDRQNIQKNKLKAQDLAKIKNILQQEELALQQKSLVVEQEINTITEIYAQQIQRITMAYAQQFQLLQQQMSVGH